MARKLDRVLANTAWMGAYGNTQVDFLEAGISYHSLSMVTVDKLRSFGLRPSKFFSFWTKNADFLNWVEEGWSLYVEGVPMFRLYAQLKAVKRILKDKTSICYGGIHQKVAQAKERLEQAHREILMYNGQVNFVKKEKECLHEFLSISKAKEAYYK